MKADLSGVGLRHLRMLSLPRGEIVLTSRLLSHSSYLAAALLLLGCSEEKSQGCRRPEAPFRLQITAEMGPLPDDTHLTVFYQGGKPVNMQDPPHEDYDLRHPPAGNIDVCCRTGAPVQGKLPAVPCGSPATTRDASSERDATTRGEAATEASTPSRDAAREQDDAAGVSEGGSKTDAGTSPSSGAPGAILCELWTNGPADVVVTGSTYPKLSRSLSVKFDECGPVTRDVRIIWTHIDGGS